MQGHVMGSAYAFRCNEAEAEEKALITWLNAPPTSFTPGRLQDPKFPSSWNMRFTDLRLPSHLILHSLTLLTSAFSPTSISSSNSSSDDGTTFCLSTTPSTSKYVDDYPLYLFNPSKSCSDQVVIFTSDLTQSHNFCYVSYQSYQFTMCGKNVTMRVNGGPKSLVGVREIKCGVELEIEGEHYQAEPRNEANDTGTCYSKDCGLQVKGKGGREVFGVFEWRGLPLC